MKRMICTRVSIGLWLAVAACQRPPEVSPAEPSPARDTVLIFSRTAGYRHASIPVGRATLTELAHELGWRVQTSEAPEAFLELDRVRCVVFLSTTGDVLGPAEQAAFERWFQGGGAWMGIHAATDTEYDWPWFTALAGAQFASHPAIQSAQIRPVSDHASVSFLPDPWERTDEWYNFQKLSDAITPLLNLEEASYSGGTQGALHPIAWTQEFDGGRAWYTGGGHTEASYAEPLFRRHLREGLRSCAGTFEAAR
jgi:type 1 glutamine amidotransferase